MKTKIKGFTLLEMLVVVGIVGLLSASAVVIFSNARMKSRDTRRVAYVKQITDALELYYLHNGIYPTAITAGQNLSVGSTLYLNPVPSNPSPRTDGTCLNQNFNYTVKPGNNGYDLRFCLGGATNTLSAGLNVCSQGGTCNSSQPDTIAGLLVWFRADWLNANDGDLIAAWPDSSPNANNATTLSVGNRPTFKANALNGKPALRFDGSNDVLNLDSNVTMASTAFVVMRWDHQIFDFVPILGSSTTYDFHGLQETGTGTDKIVSSFWASSCLTSGSAWNNGTSVAVSSIDKDRTNFQLVELQTTCNVQFNNISNDRNNPGRYMHGDIAEIIVYDSVLSTANRQKVERYLKDKYNLTIAGI